MRLLSDRQDAAPASPGADRGPFPPEVNALLSACFGQSLDQVSVSRGEDAGNAAIGALASTQGSHISLSSLVTEDLDHPGSMEVLAHEVAHALAAGGSGLSLLDRPGDPGEKAATGAGRSFRQYLEGGPAGPAPQLQVAHGGEAVVHRFESAEHKDAVDSTVEILQQAGRPGGGQVDPNVARQLEQTVRLANGLEVSPGEITALMGDFYGKFDDKGNFDPAASFEQLNNADPEEMQALREAILREENGEEIDASEWESITRNRRSDSGELSYLELAKQNNSHFSAPTMEGTNNNMGAYSAFHQMALQAAEAGDPERARALESSGMHYLTDRHASGHNFEKDAVMAESGYESGGIMANMFVKAVHDDMNANGITVTNAAGESWIARGDAHWNDEENRENQRRTAESVYSSWSELNDALAGTRSAESITDAGYAAANTVPQWDQQRQEGAEQTARNLNAPGLIWQYGGDAPDAIWGSGVRWFGENIENPVSDAYGWAERKVGDATDWVGEKANDVSDWAGEKANDVSDWAGDQVDSAGRTLKDVAGWLGF